MTRRSGSSGSIGQVTIKSKFLVKERNNTDYTYEVWILRKSFYQESFQRQIY